MVKQIDSNIHVIIAARHLFYRLGVKTLLSVIGIDPQVDEADTGEALISLLKNKRELGVRVLVTDDLMKTSADKLIANLREYCPQCKVMVMCNCPEGNTNLRYCVGSSHSQKEILERFQDFFYEPDDTADSYDAADKCLLSEREVEILKSVALGMTNKEIGDKLCISINTVISHRKNITEKLGVKTIAGLTVYAIMHNIIKPEEVTQ